MSSFEENTRNEFAADGRREIFLFRLVTHEAALCASEGEAKHRWPPGWRRPTWSFLRPAARDGFHGVLDKMLCGPCLRIEYGHDCKLAGRIPPEFTGVSWS